MLENSVAGVAELPQVRNAKGLNNYNGIKTPAETPANPRQCPTGFEALERLDEIYDAELEKRLSAALHDAGRSALGLPGTVDTFKDMLRRAGLSLVLT